MTRFNYHVLEIRKIRRINGEPTKTKQNKNGSSTFVGTESLNVGFWAQALFYVPNHSI